MTLKHNPREQLPAKVVNRLQHTRHPERYDEEAKAATRREDLKKQLTADYRNTFDSDAGVAVLRDLADLCGFTKTSVCGSITDGTLDMVGTIHNEAMRKVYLHIRQYLRPSTLTKVENHG